MEIFKKAKRALRKYISENKDKVTTDLKELREKSKNSGDATSSCRYCGGDNILSFDNDKYCKDCDLYL